MTRLRPSSQSLLLLALALALPALAAEPAPADPKLTELRRVTAYDAKAPLDVKTVRTQQRGDVTVTELTYASPKGGPVPAYLVTPKGPGPFPAVLFLHWAKGTKNEFLDEALSLARAGVVSLLVDSPHVRAEPWNRPLSGPAVYDTHVGLLMDLRRGVDLLTSRTEVDGQRLGFVGHARGATVGGALAGIEPRLRALVLVAGIGDFSARFRETEGADTKQPRDAAARERLDTTARNLEPLDGTVGVRHAAPAALFFQYGRADPGVTYARARAFIDAASEPKLSKFYEGGHELSDAARRDRAQWLRTHLGFSEVPAPGLPVIALSTAPELKGQPLPEWTKLRPVLTVPGMEEVPVRRGLTYARANGREYKLDLYLPDGASRAATPVVVLVHGLMHPALAPFVRELPPLSPPRPAGSRPRAS
ncbi:alpha/beta hydrolase family protein, partial [Pyxidicoccus sp. 3LFB2]